MAEEKTAQELLAGMAPADWAKQKTGSLRSALRRLYPACKGAFASQASKQDCIDILSGKRKAMDVMDVWLTRMASESRLAGLGGGNIQEFTKNKEVNVIDDEGRAMGYTEPAAEVADLAGGEHSIKPGGEESPMAKAMFILDRLDPKAGKAFRDRVKALDVEDVRLAAIKSMVAVSGDSVVIDGTKCPLFDDADRVPKVDELYRFDVWNASRECGAVTFRQGVGDLLKVLLAGERVLLVGPPSVGKTSVLAQAAARMQWSMTRFNGNRDVSVDSFVGCWTAINGNTKWIDGPLTSAMRNGDLLIIDEVDHMPAECSSVLHSVLEPGGSLLLVDNGGEVVEPHERFQIAATANTAGFGDESGLHPNDQVQDAAFLSRFGVVFRVGWPAEQAEAEIVAAASGMSKMTCGRIVTVATDSRRACEAGDLLMPITIRQTIGWAKMAMLMGFPKDKSALPTAFAITTLNKCTDADVPAIAEIAQRHMGETLGMGHTPGMDVGR